jgi:hypothetical protein
VPPKGGRLAHLRARPAAHKRESPTAAPGARHKSTGARGGEHHDPKPARERGACRGRDADVHQAFAGGAAPADTFATQGRPPVRHGSPASGLGNAEALGRNSRAASQPGQLRLQGSEVARFLAEGSVSRRYCVRGRESKKALMSLKSQPMEFAPRRRAGGKIPAFRQRYSPVLETPRMRRTSAVCNRR